jgi:hypothetical protein
MVVEGIAILSALLTAYSQEIENNKRMTRKQKQDAMLALNKAFHTTEGYYASLHAGRAKDEVKQHEIAELWDAAAVHVLPFNENLANRLGLKSQYWREGAAWSDAQIAQAKIGLEQIRRDGRFALRRR